MNAHPQQLVVPTPDDMATLGVALSHRLSAGTVVALSGDIGAGKSVLCRALIQSLLPQPEDIPSPTFTLVQTYDGRDFEIWHCDLYRLNSPDQVDELGLFDAFATALVLIEWPDVIANDLPDGHVSIKISTTPDNNSRIVHINGLKDRI